MSCCPPAPSINVGSGSDEDYPAQDTEPRKGETVDCYMRRSGNTTGRHDDKTDYIPNKIVNTDIPLSAEASVNVTFKLTPNSTRTATSWVMKDGDGNVISNFSGPPTVTLSGNVLAGTFAPAYHGKSIKITITAKDATGDIDERGFVFSPVVAKGSNEIQFIHPLPGSTCTSKFGPRRPPASGASSQHGGADFAYAGGVTKDVLAAADGEVEFTGFQNGGAGNYIKIRHLNASGKHLCTTVYMHLNKIYVQQGQKVAAGQKIGLEGNTGVGTGPHLHFECRLPSGTKIDPVPLIRGTLPVAQETNPDNSAKAGTVENTPAQNNVLTPENVQAKENGCEPFGPEYPKDPTETNVPVPPSDDPFEKAWFFTMKHEVGPQWETTSPSDPEIAAGLIQTPAQKKKVGYVNHSADPGGETKFGVAQGPNPGINVNSIDYANAKKTGFNNYWKRGAEALSSSKPRSAIMNFDFNYLHGVGNANKIKSTVDLAALTDLEACDALCQAQQNFMRAIVANNPKRAVFLKGWLKRSNELLAYAKSITI